MGKNILLVLLLIGGPMAVAELLYRLIDHRGKLTGKLTNRFPILKKKKMLIQVGGVVGFVIVFGLISLLFHIPVTVFFIISGVVVGLINGMALTIMYNE